MLERGHPMGSAPKCKGFAGWQAEHSGNVSFLVYPGLGPRFVGGASW